MDKTIKINLAGMLFQIDEKAYVMLRDYLQSIDLKLGNTPPGGKETMDDIEARIAEIFQSGLGGREIINAGDVENVIKIIGNPEEFEQENSDAERKSSGRSYKRRLYRDSNNRVIAGVCNGIGAYLNIDPVWIRLIFIFFTFAYATGLLLYVLLWIALPEAKTEIQKRELYGENYYSRFSGNSSSSYGKLAGLLNSLFMVFGKIFRIIALIMLALTGSILVISGFAFLVVFSLVFYLRFPVSLFHDGTGAGTFSVADFLDFITAPALTPWIMILVSFVVILPLIALIYWGLKMIFRFRTNELWVSVSAMIIWLISFTALLMIMVPQGMNYSEEGRKAEQLFPQFTPDTLYIKTAGKIAELDFEKELTIPGTGYSLFIARDSKRLFSKPEIEFHSSDDGKFFISVEKSMFGSSRRDALRKAEALIYKYQYSGDTLYVDQYYEIPPELKWSGSYIETKLFLPENTIIWIDRDAEVLFGDEYCDEQDIGEKYWLWDGEKLVSPSAR